MAAAKLCAGLTSELRINYQMPKKVEEDLQSRAKECIKDYYKGDCDPLLAVRYTTKNSVSISAVATLMYSFYGILTKSNGKFGCSCKEFYVDRLKERGYHVGTLYCAFSTDEVAEQRHDFDGEKYINVQETSDIKFEDLDDKEIDVKTDHALSLEVRNGVVEGIELLASIGKPKPPTPLEEDLTDEVASDLAHLLETIYHIARYVVEEYSYGEIAKRILIKELTTQKRYARFQWLEGYTKYKYFKEAGFSDLLPEVYSPTMAADYLLKDCGPFIIYNLNISRGSGMYEEVAVGCGLLKTSIGNFGTCYMTLDKDPLPPENPRRSSKLTKINQNRPHLPLFKHFDGI
ncbi:unnamed protein product [Cylicocyclus nassatus]|uniref:Uncharacterized protein n=1 Tax=Cylicocyclus nassatus TaxID=53992 RepID=A0AA36DS77_CYLNA|nr:unnamed protein product [Cylicocyclus nassatus]